MSRAARLAATVSVALTGGICWAQMQVNKQVNRQVNMQVNTRVAGTGVDRTLRYSHQSTSRMMPSELRNAYWRSGLLPSEIRGNYLRLGPMTNQGQSAYFARSAVNARETLPDTIVWPKNPSPALKGPSTPSAGSIKFSSEVSSTMVTSTSTSTAVGSIRFDSRVR